MASSCNGVAVAAARSDQVCAELLAQVGDVHIQSKCRVRAVLFIKEGVHTAWCG